MTENKTSLALAFLEGISKDEHCLLFPFRKDVTAIVAKYARMEEALQQIAADECPPWSEKAKAALAFDPLSES